MPSDEPINSSTPENNISLFGVNFTAKCKLLMIFSSSSSSSTIEKRKLEYQRKEGKEKIKTQSIKRTRNAYAEKYFTRTNRLLDKKRVNKEDPLDIFLKN
jgi:hypothetical protein